MKQRLLLGLTSLLLAATTTAKAAYAEHSVAGKTFIHTFQNPTNGEEFHFWLRFPVNEDRLVEISDDFWGGSTPDCDLRQTITPCVERHFFYDLNERVVTLFDRFDGHQKPGKYNLSLDGTQLTDHHDGLVYKLNP